MTKHQTNDVRPLWVHFSDSDNEYLPEMLKFGSENYERQTNWFLHHRDTGLRNVAAVLAAEFTVTSLYFAETGVPASFTVVALFLLAVLAPLLAISACFSCGRAFKAALESVVLITKAAWAMGLADDVSVAKKPAGSTRAPVHRDLTFYVPRYWIDARKYDTTEAFVAANLQAYRNTYFRAKLTIWVFSVGATAGIGAGLVILSL